jgi:hypothetical protein
MRIGPLIFVCWLLIFIGAWVGVVLHFARYRTRGLSRVFLCPLGAVFLLGFYVAFIGLAESTWSIASPALWAAFTVGLFGLVLTVLGWKAVRAPLTRPGHCRACEYDLSGLGQARGSVCPECGAPLDPGA